MLPISSYPSGSGHSESTILRIGTGEPRAALDLCRRMEEKDPALIAVTEAVFARQQSKAHAKLAGHSWPTPLKVTNSGAEFLPQEQKHTSLLPGSGVSTDVVLKLRCVHCPCLACDELTAFFVAVSTYGVCRSMDGIEAQGSFVVVNPRGSNSMMTALPSTGSKLLERFLSVRQLRQSCQQQAGERFPCLSIYLFVAGYSWFVRVDEKTEAGWAGADMSQFPGPTLEGGGFARVRRFPGEGGGVP